MGNRTGKAHSSGRDDFEHAERKGEEQKNDDLANHHDEHLLLQMGLPTARFVMTIGTRQTT